MQILSLLGMYFAAVVFVTKSSLLFRLVGCGHTVITQKYETQNEKYPIIYCHNFSGQFIAEKANKIQFRPA